MNYVRKLFSPVEYPVFRLASRVGQRRAFYRAYQTLKPARKDIAAFQNRHPGERCFIMGGGPSLKLIDPRHLKNEVTFGVNGVFLIYDWLGFEPTYYCVEDWLVFEDRQGEIVQSVNASECFFPIQFSGPSFDRPNHHYFRALYDFSMGKDWPDFAICPDKMVWIGGTVSYVCLQLAFYMGFREVYLIGFDHHYVRPEHITAQGTEWTSHGDDPNHFHKDYFGSGKRWHDPRTDRMELAYRKARKIFEADGRTIVNATAGGKLEVFPRVEFGGLF